MIASLIVYAMFVMTVALWFALSMEFEWTVKMRHYLRISRAVWIETYKGAIRIHILRRDANGQTWCHRLGPVGRAILLDDGTVQQPSYIERWGYWPIKENKR